MTQTRQAPLPRFTPEQQPLIEAGLRLMEHPDTVQGYGSLVEVNATGEITGLCAIGCFCQANPAHVTLVKYAEHGMDRSGSAGYAVHGQRPGLARASSLPIDFADRTGLQGSIEITCETLGDQSASLVRQVLPSFQPGWPTTLTHLNDSGKLTLPQIASVLRDLWTLPNEGQGQ